MAVGLHAAGSQQAAAGVDDGAALRGVDVGRTIMTAEPKFVPEEAVEVRMEEGVTFSVRLIDCVGYMVPGAVGQYEDLSPRMVMTPWYDHEIPMTEAAELGTRKVICDHSTVGIVVTTDGSVTEIPREDYLEAEERVIRELQELGKPFVVLLNSAQPQGSRAQSMAADIERRYDVRCLPVNCLELGEQEITELLQGLLYEFPLRELDLFLPAWVEALPPDHPIKTGVYQAVRREAADLAHVRQLRDCLSALQGEGDISAASIRSLNLGIGIAEADLDLPRSLFYDTLSRQSGLSVTDDGDLMQLLTSLAAIRMEYDRLAPAMQAALGLFPLRQLAVALLQEAVVGDDGPGVGPLADGAPAVAGLHPEGDELAVFGHAGDGGRGPDGHAHRGGGQVAGLNIHAHGALALRQVRLHAVHGGVLHHGHHKRGAEHLQAAGADGPGGHLRGDHLLNGIGFADFDHIRSSFIRPAGSTAGHTAAGCPWAGFHRSRSGPASPPGGP